MATHPQSKQTDQSEKIGHRLRRAFVRLHAALYRLTARLIRGEVKKRGTLILAARGRKSGQERDTPLFYFMDGGRFIVIGSNGGSARHPAWWLNVQAHPQVRIQVSSKVMTAMATAAEGEERERLWSIISANHKYVARYLSRVKRTIPIVILIPDKQGLA